MILTSFQQQTTQGISDPVLINSLLDVSRMLHDSVDYLTFADEKRQVSELIVHLIDYIDYGHDLERQLNAYLECRAMFSNLDAIIYCLCAKVGNLAMKAHQFMHGKHNKKTSAFVKACLAYCHVTIPSLAALWPRMYLFSNLGQIALTNSMIIQAEAFFVAAIKLIPALPVTFSTPYSSNTIESTPALLADYVAHLVSSLLLMPGHPTKGPFHLLEMLMAALSEWSVWAKDKVSPEKTRAWLSLFKVFCTLAQRKFPYHIKGVSSNDELYARNPEYARKCLAILNRFGKKIHRQLNTLKASQRSLDKAASAQCALKFLNMLVDDIQISKKSMPIIMAVHQIVVDHRSADVNRVEKAFYRNTMSHIKAKHRGLHAALEQQELDAQ